jgi:hypothetical protein
MAKTGNMLATVGSWLFIVGLVLALVSGFFELSSVWVAILIIIGLVVGFLNVTGKEATPFLMAAVSIVLVAYFGGDILSKVWLPLQRMLNSIIVLTIPATIVVAIKQIFELAKD